MSAIAGIYRADGAPVDGGLLFKMREIVDYRGPDGAGIWIQGNVGLAHRLLCTTEESVYEKQPLTNGRGFWLTADCRIDNREELRREFESCRIWLELENRFAPYPPPDSAYILWAYELWGEEVPNHLLGDFAFAIWDERNQKLFCARDPLGLKPFFYHWDGRRLLFGSEMKQIFQDASIPDQLNLTYFSDLLLMVYPDRTETPYRTLQRLAPGHSLRIHAQKADINKYWNWNPGEEPLSRRTLDENAEIFLSIFKKSISARLRVPPAFRAGSLLSGGLDSSSIVSVAATLQNEKSFPVFTLHFPEANPRYQSEMADPVDESPYQNSLFEKYSLESHKVAIQGWGSFENFEENLWYQETPLFCPTVAYFHFLFRTANQASVRVLFTGEGGDEVFGVGPCCFMEDLKKLRFIPFAREFMGLRKNLGIPLGNLVLFTLANLLPEWMKVPYRNFFKKKPLGWLRPHLKHKILLSSQRNKNLLASSSYGIQGFFVGGYYPWLFETLERAGTYAGLEVRFPFLDLRLLRFLASVPWKQKFRCGVKKLVLRRALKELLPPLIQNRFRKTEFTPAVRAGFENYGFRPFREIFENPHPHLDSMTNSEKVAGISRVYFSKDPLRSSSGREFLWPLWYLVSVDQWLKHRESFDRKLKEKNHEKGKNAAVFPAGV